MLNENTPIGTPRLNVKRILQIRNQFPINRYGTGQSISRVRVIKGFEELLGAEAPKVLTELNFKTNFLSCL
jgi:hypothetical protein